jgi:hypothetical protein
MNAKDWFGVAIRIIGLLSTSRGAFDLIYCVMVKLDMAGKSSIAADPPNITMDLVYGFIYLLAGIYLLRGAELVVDYAFPESGSDNENDDAE